MKFNVIALLFVLSSVLVLPGCSSTTKESSDLAAPSPEASTMSLTATTQDLVTTSTKSLSPVKK